MGCMEGGPTVPHHQGGGAQPLPSPQEAAAIIAQRPDNPRDFFKQQERVASGSSDAVSPGSHRTGEGLWGAVGGCGHRGGHRETRAQVSAVSQLNRSQWDMERPGMQCGEGMSPLPTLALWFWVPRV